MRSHQPPCPRPTTGTAMPPALSPVTPSRDGEANGNGLNLNGGLWHAVTASGKPIQR